MGKILKVALAIVVALSMSISGAGALYNHDWGTIKHKPTYFIFKGAHAPYGFCGIIDEYYFWTQGYGPAGSVGQPRFYDINTGEFVMEYYGNCSVDIFGSYISIEDINNSEGTNKKVHVYNGSKLILVLRHDLLYIDDSMWHILDGDEIISYSRGQNLVVSKIKLQKGFVKLWGFENKKDNIYYFAKEGSDDVLAVDLKTLDQKHVSRKTLKERKFVEDIDKKPTYIKWDYESRTATNTKTNLKYKTMYEFGQNCIVGNYLLDYSDNHETIKCIALETMTEVWSRKCNIGGACVYKGNLYCSFGGSKNPKQACIEVKTGRILWTESSFIPSYYWSVFIGDTAYDNANGRFVRIDLKTGRDLMSIQRDNVTVIDFDADRYYTYDAEYPPHCYDLSTHRKVW